MSKFSHFPISVFLEEFFLDQLDEEQNQYNRELWDIEDYFLQIEADLE